MTQGKTASSVNELISCLRQWRDSTPDAWILHTADVLERFQKELTASMTHARILNSLLGKVEAENAKLRRVVDVLRACLADHSVTLIFAEGSDQLTDALDALNTKEAYDDKQRR